MHELSKTFYLNNFLTKKKKRIKDLKSNQTENSAMHRNPTKMHARTPKKKQKNKVVWTANGVTFLLSQQIANNDSKNKQTNKQSNKQTQTITKRNKQNKREHTYFSVSS